MDKKCHIATEELIAQAESVSINGEESIQTDLTGFLSSLRIKRGRFRVSLTALYSIYKFWSNEPLSKREFSRELKLRFKRVRDKYEIYYLLHRGMMQDVRFRPKKIK